MNRWAVPWMSSAETLFANCRILNSCAHKRMGKNNLEDIFLAEAAEKTIKNKNKKGFDLKTECI